MRIALDLLCMVVVGIMVGPSRGEAE